MKTKKGIVVIVLAAALVVWMVGIVSANSITWELDQNGIMYKGDHTEAGSVTILAEGSQVWKSENPATPDGGVYFSAETWTGRLTTTVTDYTVDIGYTTDGLDFTSNGGDTGGHDYFSNGGSYWYLDANGFTVPQGKSLALKVTATSALTVTTDGTSCVIWPEDQPNYPVPELPTIILMSAGLLALMGYVGYRRRNNK